MTRNFLFIFFIIASLNSISSQKIWQGDLINSQFEIFKASDFSEINGNLIIENTKLTELKLLSNLTKVNGNILIYNNDSLTCLQGLEKLKEVNGKISVRKNKRLNNYCALSKYLLSNGIKGEEVNNNIFDRFDAWDNKYNPDRMDLINGECEYTFPSFNFSI